MTKGADGALVDQLCKVKSRHQDLLLEVQADHHHDASQYLVFYLVRTNWGLRREINKTNWGLPREINLAFPSESTATWDYLVIHKNQVGNLVTSLSTIC